MPDRQQIVEQAWEARATIAPASASGAVKDAVQSVIAGLDGGTLRVAEKLNGQWLMLRLLFDQGDMTSELEVRINSEKNLDLKAGLLYYLGAYWVARGKPDLGSKYIRMSYDSERMGILERRLAEADLARLATPK